jgi:Na+(H+)/acetate symporter ActP
MNKITASNKFVLMIATMLPAIMLATSLTLSLIPTIAFAQEDNEDSDNQSDINENEGGDNSVIVEPIVQPTTDVDLNIDVNTHVITDEEDCDEARDEESQENDQDAYSLAHKCKLQLWLRQI